MPIEINKCPNCNGKLEVIHSRKKLVCTFCGSEFALDDDTQKEIGDHPVSHDWFIYDWNYEKVMANPACNTVITAFTRGLNEYETSTKLETYMRDYLMNFDEVSAEGIREDRMKGIVQRYPEVSFPESVLSSITMTASLSGARQVLSLPPSVHSSLRRRPIRRSCILRFLISISDIPLDFRN